MASVRWYVKKQIYTLYSPVRTFFTAPVRLLLSIQLVENMPDGPDFPDLIVYVSVME